MPSKKPADCPKRRQFGRNVVELRKRLGVTQEALAERAGISARYFQAVEAGDYWPSLPTLATLKVLLKCSWDDLLDGCA